MGAIECGGHRAATNTAGIESYEPILIRPPRTVPLPVGVVDALAATGEKAVPKGRDKQVADLTGAATEHVEATGDKLFRPPRPYVPQDDDSEQPTAGDHGKDQQGKQTASGSQGEKRVSADLDKLFRPPRPYVPHDDDD